MNVENMQRSRLKVTFIFGGAAFLLCFFPMYVILMAANENTFDISAPWIALGTLATAFVGISGYYLQKETQRPSLLSTTIIRDSLNHSTDKLLPAEDESDPDNIPL